MVGISDDLLEIKSLLGFLTNCLPLHPALCVCQEWRWFWQIFLRLHTTHRPTRPRQQPHADLRLNQGLSALENLFIMTWRPPRRHCSIFFTGSDINWFWNTLENTISIGTKTNKIIWVTKIAEGLVSKILWFWRRCQVDQIYVGEVDQVYFGEAYCFGVCVKFTTLVKSTRSTLLVNPNFVLGGCTVSPMAATLLLWWSLNLCHHCHDCHCHCNQHHHQEHCGLPAEAVGTHKTPRQSHDRRAPG